MKSYSFHPEASLELDLTVDRYNVERTGLGSEFFVRFEDSLKKLLTGLSFGSPWLQNSRLQTLKQFPYGIVFRELDAHIYILAVYHFSRREDYWFHRLDDAPDINLTD